MITKNIYLFDEYTDAGRFRLPVELQGNDTQDRRKMSSPRKSRRKERAIKLTPRDVAKLTR